MVSSQNALPESCIVASVSFLRSSTKNNNSKRNACTNMYEKLYSKGVTFIKRWIQEQL